MPKIELLDQEPAKIRQYLETRFSLEELWTLAADLGISFGFAESPTTSILAGGLLGATISSEQVIDLLRVALTKRTDQEIALIYQRLLFLLTQPQSATINSNFSMANPDSDISTHHVIAPDPIPTTIKTKDKLQVLLCHASADKPAVSALYNRLVNYIWIRAWLDAEDLIAGQDWQLEIPKAVRQSDVVLVCLSVNSINKAGYVQKEIKYALDVADEKPEGAIYLIPLRLEDCIVPKRLGKPHWVDYFKEDGFAKLLKALSFQAEKLGVIQQQTTQEEKNSKIS
jgi:hypothetical protein